MLVRPFGLSLILAILLTPCVSNQSLFAQVIMDESGSETETTSESSADDKDDAEEAATETEADGEKASKRGRAKAGGKKTKGKTAAKKDEAKKDDADADADDDDADDEEEVEDITLKGHFVASKMIPISRRLEEWSSMTIEKIVPHGKQIKAGDVLVTLDMTEIDKAISDQEHALEMEKLSLQQSREQFELLKKTTKIDLEEVRRDAKIAKEDMELFLKRDKKMLVESQQQSLKSQENYLSYQEEELEQLLKMYEADDLTEETEEIILKRTKDQVEQGRFYLERYRTSYEDFMDTGLARRQEQMERSTERVQVALERSEATMPAALREAGLSLQKEEVTHQRSKEKLETLKRDRKAMVIKAPRGGTVYYGKSENGTFASSRKLAEELRPNGSLKSDEVFMTVLELRPVHILADVDEDDLRHIRKGATVSVVAAAFPDVEINAKVVEVSKFPVDDGKFGVRLTCRLGSKSDRVVPGMTCEVKITPQPEKKSKK